MCSTMPAPNERSDGTPMIVDHSQIPEDTAVGQIAALEKDLFGRGAWSEQSVRQEFHAPARTYLLDIEGDAVQTADPVVRGYAGYWYDGDDAEIMTIGVGRPYQRQGIAAAPVSYTHLDVYKRQGHARKTVPTQQPYGHGGAIGRTVRITRTRTTDAAAEDA